MRQLVLLGPFTDRSVRFPKPLIYFKERNPFLYQPPCIGHYRGVCVSPPPLTPALAVEEAFTSLRNYFLWLALKFTKEMSANFLVRR